MDIQEVFEKRRSVRSFEDKDIDQSIIDDMLHSAYLAPETDTCRCYFGVIQDEAVKNKIAAATLYAEWTAKAPVIFTCCTDIGFDLAEEKDDSYAVLGMKKRYGEDLVRFLRTNENRKASKTLMLGAPAYIAAQHIILTAVSHGLMGCMVDFIDLGKINGILNLPHNVTCQLIVPVGYSQEKPKQKNKRQKSFFYESWDSDLRL